MNAALEVVKCVCGVTAYPSMNMDERMRIAPCCPTCGREHRTDSTPVATNVVSLRPAALAGPRSDPSLDPVGLIQARIAFLDEKLSKCAEYQKERRRLARMMKAAGASK